VGNETKTEQAVPEPERPVAKFTKAQLLGSSRYSNRKDALSVLLEEDKSYSHDEVAEILENFLKKKVK